MTNQEYKENLINKAIAEGRLTASIHGGAYSVEELVYFDGSVSYIVHYSEQGNDLYLIKSKTNTPDDIENAIKKYLNYLAEQSSMLARI